MRTIVFLLLVISIQSNAQHRIDQIFEGFRDTRELRVTTDHGEMLGIVHLEYNAQGEPLLHRVSVVSDNYLALAATCSKLVQRQLEQGSEFVEGQELSTDQYMYLIESHENFRIVMKDDSYYWTLKGDVVPNKSEEGVEEYELIAEGEDWSRHDE